MTNQSQKRTGTAENTERVKQGKNYSGNNFSTQ